MYKKEHVAVEERHDVSSRVCTMKSPSLSSSRELWCVQAYCLLPTTAVLYKRQHDNETIRRVVTVAFSGFEVSPFDKISLSHSVDNHL